MIGTGGGWRECGREGGLTSWSGHLQRWAQGVHNDVQICSYQWSEKQPDENLRIDYSEKCIAEFGVKFSGFISDEHVDCIVHHLRFLNFLVWLCGKWFQSMQKAKEWDSLLNTPKSELKYRTWDWNWLWLRGKQVTSRRHYKPSSLINW